MFLLFLVSCWRSQVREALHDYEYFHSAYNQILAKQQQIAAQKTFMASEENPEETRMLRTELSGMQQSCRDLVAEYNADSDKVNVGIFQGGSLPNHVDPQVCE